MARSIVDFCSSKGEASQDYVEIGASRPLLPLLIRMEIEAANNQRIISARVRANRKNNDNDPLSVYGRKRRVK